MSNGTINFQKPDGSWAAIDNSVTADPAQPGGFVNAANAWQVHFGTTTQGVTVSTAIGSIGFVPVGANTVSPVRNADGDGVTYPNAWPGADLVYTVTGDAVKESVLIKSPTAAATYAFTSTTGTPTQISTKMQSVVPSLRSQTDGSLRPDGAVGSVVAMLAPAALTKDGEPIEAAKAALATSKPGQVAVSVDPGWLASLPASAFPVNVDPTIGVGTYVDNGVDYKSDGYTCAAVSCGIQMGNSRSAGDTYWRSVVHFPYEQFFGSTILDSYIAAYQQYGTANGYWANAYAASSYSYGGACAGAVLATGTTGGNTNLDGDGLTNWLQSVVSAQVPGGALGFCGNEAGGLYTYQGYQMVLVVTSNRAPTVPAPTSPGNGATVNGIQTTLTTSGSSDPDGDPIQYLFRVSIDPGAAGIIYYSGWQSGTSLAFLLPSWAYLNTQLYFSVQASDGWITSAWSGPSAFIMADHTRPQPQLTDASPPDQAVVATTTPALSVPAVGDPEGDQVLYNFTISGGGDTPSGRASSGWIASNTWTVPSGVLGDGQSYTWSVTVGDGPLPGQSNAGPWQTSPPAFSARVTINQRLGASATSPYDSFSGVDVNLASGNAEVSLTGHPMNTINGALSVGFTYNSQSAARVGLLGQYFPDNQRVFDFSAGSFAGATLVRVDPTLDLRWGLPGQDAAPPGMPTAQYLVRWTGYLTVPTTGTYQLGTASDDGSQIILNNNTASPIVKDLGLHGTEWSPAQSLTAGTPVPIEVDYFNSMGPGNISLWIQGSGSTALGAQVMPSSWIAPTLSSLPTGWTLSLPGGAQTYTRASVGNGVVVLTDGDGGSHTYIATTGGAYKPPAGEDGTLLVAADGSMSLIDEGGSRYTFSSAGLPLTAQSATDALHPAAAVYAYDSSVSPPRATTITDAVSGQSIKLYYGNDSHCTRPAGFDQSVPSNILCGVTYWDGS